MKSIQDFTILHNGVAMPWLGFGTWELQDGAETVRTVQMAVDAGYRSIDTAAMYQNEKAIGQAIRESGIDRENFFITTKVWNNAQGYEQTLRAFEESRNQLGLDYVDLYLIHWPVKDKYIDTWKALEHLYEQGEVKAIGVCNFQIHHLESLMAACKVAPMVNQFECHPLLSQKELIRYCKEHQIQPEAWRPLMKGNHLNHPEILMLADQYGKTAAQIILRWHLQNGVVVIPKSSNEARIRENAHIFDFTLSHEDMLRIDGLNQNHRTGADPDNFDF